jgi:hypothetical protein
MVHYLGIKQKHENSQWEDFLVDRTSNGIILMKKQMEDIIRA